MSASKPSWNQAILPVESTIQEAIRNLDKSGIRIVLVVNAVQQFQGTISDGDIRRGLLKGLDLSSPIESIIHRNAFVVTPEVEPEMVRQLMAANKIQQVPVVDKKHHVAGLHLWDEITAPSLRPNLMVIMAGGMGTRLRPHTETCPKPMLPVAGRPMLEHIIDRAKREGFSRFVLAIHYLGKMVEDHFGKGDKLGVKIDYLREKSPLGTAGALGLLNPIPDDSFVVTNGDVVTDIRYGELIDFHSRHSAIATMAVKTHEWQHPYGVVHIKGVEIIGLEEKPVVRSHINAGIYALSPAALKKLKAGDPCDMTTLFRRLQDDAKRTVAYPMHEPWLDVGQPSDLTLVNSRNLK